MLRMPVATLRVWERRYALTNTVLSAGGQRLYSASDVRRLALIKQLVDLGHAIGSLAAMDMAQLQQVATTHAQALADTQAGRAAGRGIAGAAQARRAPRAAQTSPAARPWRLVVVGSGLAARLKRPTLLRQLGRPVQLLGPYTDLAQADAALATLAGTADAGPADAWLLQQPQLQAGWLAAAEAAAPHWAQSPQRPPMAVLYGFAADAVCEALAAQGVVLLREPQPDAVLAQWLRHWAGHSTPPATAAALPRPIGNRPPTPARWSDAALADFAALSSTVACECPVHVAELLVQLGRFESYSAQCEQLGPADAELHAYLGHVAAEARASFEAALEQVALREGLLLPPSPL